MNRDDHLLFVHANGFTPGAYRQMLEPLADRFFVSAVELRPLRDNMAPTPDWRLLAWDVGEGVDRFGRPVTGVGHSLGAVTLLLSAASRPERYRRLVLIEPVALPPWMTTLLRYAPVAVRRRGPLAAAARNRSDRWSDVMDAFAFERRRRWLARVSDSVLSDILHNGLKDDGRGVTLRFGKEWEATLYETPANIWPLLRQALPPITIMRGADSKILDHAALRRWKKIRPADTIIEVADAGHLLPLERPAETARMILGCRNATELTQQKISPWSPLRLK